jgi:hypothetical protein
MFVNTGSRTLRQRIVPLPNAIHIRAVSSTTQAIASTTDPQIITYDLVTDKYKITCVKGGVSSLSRFILPIMGDYHLDYFATTNSTSGAHSCYIWLRKNGVDIPYTCLSADFNATNAPNTSSRGIIFDGFAGDYIELWMAGDNTAVELLAISESLSAPIRPATPSIVVNIHMIGTGT